MINALDFQLWDLSTIEKIVVIDKFLENLEGESECLVDFLLLYTKFKFDCLWLYHQKFPNGKILDMDDLVSMFGDYVLSIEEIEIESDCVKSTFIAKHKKHIFESYESHRVALKSLVLGAEFSKIRLTEFFNYG